jgi:GTP cyclohydrolase IB
LWIEDLVPLVEEAGSCPVYPLLKRVDEKYVTEKAYENPKFVEDISRDIAVILESLPINFYKIRVSNQESIHMHDATAYITREKVNGIWVHPDGR